MALHFKTLGIPELLVDGLSAARLRYRKAYALLGYLAVERDRWHSRRQLADLLWPRLEPDAARANLRLVLKSVADALEDAGGCGCLRMDRERAGLFSDPSLRIDITMFDEAVCGALRRCENGGAFRQIAAPWQTWLERLEGDFLAGVDADENGEFEDWLGAERARLDRLRSAFLRECLHAARRCGLAADAMNAARAWIRCSPVDDEAARAHMELVAQGDGPAAALGAYEDFARRLEYLAGAVPAAETEGLRARIALAAGGMPASAPTARDEVRRVVVLHVEPDLPDEIELLEPERSLAPLADALGDALARWGGRQFPVTGMALGAVFGLADDGEQGPRRALAAAREIAAQPAFRRARLGLAEGRALIAPAAPAPIAGSILPALAQRLAMCGEPGDIIAAEALTAGVGGYAAYEPLPRRRFAGLAGEHAPYRIAPAPPRRGDAMPLAFATPFVGRERELRALGDAIDAVLRESRSRFMEVVGLPGAGKSRLLAELARRHGQAGGVTRWVGHRPELRHVALGALRDRDDVGPQLSGRRLIDAIIARLFAPAAAGAPVLLVFDDLHWADEATRELIGIAAQAQPPAPVLAVLASRPVPHAEAVAARLPLEPLATEETIALIAAADPDNRIDTLRRAQLARMSGGLPLCAEYIARAAGDRPVSDASLFGVLQGVLDRLGEDKTMLQAAAVLGTEFDADGLRRLLPDRDVGPALDRAMTLAIVERRGNATFGFHHALLRDCAYDSAPPPVRRAWHRRAADWLAQQPTAAPADVAQHYEAADAWGEAFDAWRKAAEAAYLDEFAADAQHAAQRALAAADKHGRCGVADRAELELLAGFATLMSDGYGARRAQKIFGALLERPAGELPDEMHFRALAGMVAAYPQGRSENLAAMDQLRLLARSPAHHLNVHYGFGSMLFWRGEFATSLAHLDKAIELGAAVPPRQWLRYTADNPVVTCMALKAVNLSLSADAATAIATADAAVGLARSQGRVHGLCFALTLAASVHCLLDRPRDTAQFAAEGLELAKDRKFQFWQAYNAIFGLWADAAQGPKSMAASFKLLPLHREIAAASRLSPVTSWWFVANACEAMANWSLLDMITARALALAENGGDTYCMPDLMRQRALAKLGRGDTAAAQRWLDKARCLAQAQGSLGMLRRIERSAERFTAV